MGKIIDITGQKFGNLTVLYPARVKGRFGWHCKCDCGNECDIESGNLRSGRQKSCGCQRVKSGKARKKDLTGQKFGRLTVLRETDERQCGAIVWECQCDCGNIIKVPTGNLTSGHTQSCGCFSREVSSQLNFMDLTGQRFGRLLVIEKEPDKSKEKSKSVWKCQCDCGGIAYVTTANLKNGHTMSCGCLNSKGEELISQILVENKIPFEKQKTFESCKFPWSDKPAKFDFFVDNQYIIEYDGIQHFIPGGWNDQGALEKTIDRDNFKNQWCLKNNIPLIRIPYTRFDNLNIHDLILEESEFVWQPEKATSQNS